MKDAKDPGEDYEVLGGAKYDDVDKSKSRRRMRIAGYDDPPISESEQEDVLGDSEPETGGFLRRNNVMERN